MEILLLIWVIMAALAWLAILLLPWQPWRNNLVLRIEPLGGDPPGSDLPGSDSLHLSAVTVVIPARDEALVIGESLRALSEQGPGLHVILVDDNSSDGTAAIARAVPGLDLQVIPGQPLPPGWSGKLWAQEQGVRLVKTPFTLLLDADIQLGAGVVAALLAQRAKGYAFVSVMASLHMQTFWEKLLMPAFIYFFKMLYPFVPANSPNRRFYSAAGGCILLETRLLAEIGGLESIRSAVIDDCTLAARVKKAGLRTWIGQSRAVNSIRPYRDLAEIWNMVARSAYNQLSYSPLILALCTFGLLTLFIAPLCGLLATDPTARLLGVSALALMAASYIPTLRYYSLNPAWALLMPLSGVLYLGMTLSSALRYYRGERTRWKGRVYSNPKGLKDP